MYLRQRRDMRIQGLERCEDRHRATWSRPADGRSVWTAGLRERFRFGFDNPACRSRFDAEAAVCDPGVENPQHSGRYAFGLAPWTYAYRPPDLSLNRLSLAVALLFGDFQAPQAAGAQAVPGVNLGKCALTIGFRALCVLYAP